MNQITPQPSDSIVPFRGHVPVIPLQGDVPFPLSVVSEIFRTPYSLQMLSHIQESQTPFWAIWTSMEFDRKRLKNLLPSVGILSRLVSTRELGPGRWRVDIEGLSRARLVRVMDEKSAVVVQIEPLAEVDTATESIAEKISICHDLLLALVGESGQYPLELVRVAELARENADRYSDLLGASVHFSQEDKWRLAQMPDPAARLDDLAELLRAEVVANDRKHELDRRAGAAVEKRERVEFLQAQLGAVRKELELLDAGTSEIDQLSDQIGRAGLPTAVGRRARSELERLRVISTASAEYTEIRNYIDWLIHIPWTATAHERTDADEIRHLLDRDMYGQKRAKDRICKFLSVHHQIGRSSSNVLCLTGASGIGKTLLARSIAQALRRPIVTLNVGLLRSEGILKGNRRTFPGAMPGRLLRQLRSVEVTNPACILEDIDRLGADNERMDISAILLEAIDSEINHDFWDHYLEFPYDLSRVLFIFTATDPESIPEMLAERMEFVDLPGYLLEEKIEITFKFLWPRQLALHGLPESEFTLTVAAVRRIIREYTLEAGLSELKKSLEVICRHLTGQRSIGQRGFVRVGTQQVEKILGTPVYIPEKAETRPEIGVAMGVAWTQTGGDIMLIEALKMRGSGNMITTGLLGEVMRESIQAAHSWVRSRADWLGIDHDDFGNFDIHVHFPSGAIPKDGPSAGITISVVIASVLSERPIHNDFAMTGEVSLRGKVLPVGGIREKVAAAHRVGIHRIILPKQNMKDLQDVPNRISKEMEYIPVETIDEVFTHVFLDFEPAKLSLEKLLRQDSLRKQAGRRSRAKSKPPTRTRSRVKARVGRKRTKN